MFFSKVVKVKENILLILVFDDESIFFRLIKEFKFAFVPCLVLI